MKRLTLFLLLLVPCISSFAADKYDAYIIQLNRDTVHGYVVVEKPDMLYWQIVFEDTTHQQHTYKPGDIAGFAVEMDDEWRRFAIIDVGEPVTRGGKASLVFA